MESEGRTDRKRWEKTKKVFFTRVQSERDAGIEAVDSFFWTMVTVLYMRNRFR